MRNQQLIDQLNTFDWQRIRTILEAYALLQFRLKRLYNLLGKAPEDYVQEAIALLFEGKRNWDQDKYPDVLDFLKVTVKSLIYNDLHSKAKKQESAVEVESLQDKIESTGAAYNPEQEILYRELKLAIKNEVKGDIDLEIMCEYVEDCFEPKDFQEALGIEREEVYQLSRKLRRKTTKVLKS